MWHVVASACAMLIVSAVMFARHISLAECTRKHGCTPALVEACTISKSADFQPTFHSLYQASGASAHLLLVAPQLNLLLVASHGIATEFVCHIV